MTENINMTRRLICLTVLVSILTFSIAMAQDPGGSRGRFGRGIFGEGVVSLIGMSEVQKELRLNEEQQELLFGLQSDLRDQIRSVFVSMQERDSTTARDQIRSKIDDIDKKGEAILAAVLSTRQYQRFQQLNVQRQGARALERSEVAEQLVLSATQLLEIRKLLEAEPQDRDKLLADALAVLSDEQKQSWERMKGRPFTFPQRRFGRRSRGRGNQPDRPERSDERPERPQRP